MIIWLTRHGQTNLNHVRLMQGRVNEPLNEAGIRQAEQMREKILQKYPGLLFDAVYSSPLDRAVTTASIIGGIPRESVILDDRILETDFGKYERKNYYLLGPAMTLYWALPEVFPAPKTVESVSSMVSRSRDFLQEIEKKDYQNVLVTCHGGILRALCGYMEDRDNGIKWRPKPHNCEVRVFESVNGVHKSIDDITL